MPAELLEDPPGISCLFSDGRRCRRVVAGEPADLVRDLLEGLAAMVHPHGSIDSPSTMAAYTVGIRDMAGFMRDRGVRGGAVRLSRALLAEYWMQASRLNESTTRRMVTSLDTARGEPRCRPGSASCPPGGTSPHGRLPPRWPPTPRRNGNGCTQHAGRLSMTRSTGTGGR